MSKKIPRITYDEENDVLHVIIAEGEEEGFIELAPNINLEIGEKGRIIGIEILNVKEMFDEKAQKLLGN